MMKNSNAFTNQTDFWNHYRDHFGPLFDFSMKKAKAVTDENTRESHRLEITGKQFDQINGLVNADPNGLFVYFLTAVCIGIWKNTAQDQLMVHMPALKGNADTPQPYLRALAGEDSFKTLLNAVKNDLNNFMRFQADHTISSEFKSNVLLRFEAIHQEPSDQLAYDLVINISKRAQSFAFDLTYDTSAFDAHHIVNFSNHLARIMSYSDQLTTALKDIQVLSEDEELDLIKLGKARQFSLPFDTIHRCFEDRAARTPDNVAVIYRDEQLTYQELNEVSNKLAHYLITDYQIQQGDLVGIMTDRSEKMIIAMLAVLKAGAVFVPIDTKLPESRRNFIMQDADIKLLITDFFEVFQEHQVPLLSLDLQLAVIEAERVNLDTLVGADSLAYVLYTSGTTGQPKGVMVQHAGFVSMSLSQVELMQINEQSNVLQIASLSFDTAMSEIFMALFSGATLVIADVEMINNPSLLLGYMQEKQVNVATLTPSYLSTLDIAQLGFLEVLISAGEAANAADVLKSTGVLKFFNGYGPTECSVCITMFECLDGNYQEAGVPIGLPLPNMEVRILDEHQHLVPEGVPGELYATGIGVARGYLNNPGLTAEKFLEDLEPGKRWYRTGDRARWANGQLVFCDRNDRQLKLGGIRVEPGEIENHLKSHPAVKNSVVFTASEDHSNQLVAAVAVDKEEAHVAHEILKLEQARPELTEQRFKLPNGLPVYHINEAETRAIYDEIFDEQVYSKNDISIGRGDVIVDIGANIGLFSLYMGLNHPGVEILAFEPVGPIYEVLQKNVTIYPFPIRHFNQGISDAPGKATFQYYPGNTAMSSRYGDVSHEVATAKQYMANKLENANAAAPIDDYLEQKLAAVAVECELITLSQVIDGNSLKKIDLLKIDAEKSELDVLNGLSKEYWSLIRQVVIEVHDIDGAIAKIRSMLDAYHFSYTIEQSADLAGTDIFTIYGINQLFDIQTEVSDATANGQRGESSLLVSHPDQVAEQLRDYCADYLPAYMVPGRIEILGELPMTHNGKVDTARIESLLNETKKEANYVAPGDQREQTLADIWGKVLGKEKVGITDDFFQLGGDSIKAIQIASKLAVAGYQVDISKIFEYTTIDVLAKQLETDFVIADQSAVTGKLPLLPVQRALFTPDKTDPHHFNQSVLIRLNHTFKLGELELIFKKLQDHHDALRIVLNLVDNEWQQEVRGTDLSVSIEEFDLTHVADQEEQLYQLTGQLQASIHLSQGPLMKLGLFQSQEGPHLFITIHHMVVDTVSWRILLEDLNMLFAQHRSGAALSLPLKTESFQKWSLALKDYADRTEFTTEQKYWDNLSNSAVTTINTEFQSDENLLSDAASETVVIDQETTENLLTKTNEAFNTEINDILLATIGLAFGEVFGIHQVLLNLEGHGRNNLEGAETIDISRTVGWFTINYPVLIDLDQRADLSKYIVQTKEMLRNVPNKGMGSGLSRYRADDHVNAANPQISFNYLGQFDTDFEQEEFSVSGLSTGSNFSMRSERFHELSINSLVVEGQLKFTVEYSKKQFSAGKIATVTDRIKWHLEQIIHHCSGQQQTITPSDLTADGLSFDDLEEISSLLS